MLSAWFAALVIGGFGSPPYVVAEGEPEAPIRVSAHMAGTTPVSMLVVGVLTDQEDTTVRLDLTLPDGVEVMGNAEREMPLQSDKLAAFRVPLRAERPGMYVINVKVMSGTESYTFGRSISVAWFVR